jgi:NTE family protein
LYTETQRTGWLNSVSIYLDGETLLGPVYLGYGRSDSGSSNIHLFIATP